METFLPSEISRLVLGYLKEENCHETAKVFMRECVHLAEYLSMLHQGREFSTEVAGLSLKMILDEYGNMKLSRRVQAVPATLTNLWDKYELMGSQLRQAITPQVNPTPQPTPQPIASQFVNSMHSFSRRQGARNRYTSARTEGVLVVRQEVAITTAGAVLTTPRSVTGANIAGTFTFPASLPPLSHPAPGGTRCGAIESRAPTWSSAGRRSMPMSQMEDDLESLVSVCSSMSSVTFDRIECNVVTDHNAANDLEGDRLNRMLTIADQVLHEENARPAKIISPTSQSPLSSTHLSASTPGNLPKTSRRSTASSAAQILIKPKRSRRIQTKMMGDGAVLSPIRAPISATSCHAAPVTSHPSTLVGSGSVASHTSLAPCGYGTALSSSVVPMKTQSSETNVEMSSWNPVTSGTPGTVTPPFQFFALGSDELRSAAAMFNAPPVLSYPVVSVGSSNSDPATSFDAVPVYTVPFDPCNSGLVTSDATTSFGNVPVTCNMVPVTSCNSVPSNQVPVTITSVSANTLDQVQCGATATSPSVVPAVGTPPKRRSGSNRVDNGSGDTANPQVPLTSVRLRRHVSKEFCSPRDRRKKAQPCRRRTLAEQVFGRGYTTSNTSSSVLLCNGSASSSSAFNCSHAKTDVSDLDINAEMLERLLSSHSIAEKIAENINRLTSHGTSRSDPGPSNCPGTAPDTTSNTLSHNQDLAETTSISLPFDLSRHGKECIAPSINGCNNGLEKEISGASNTMTPVVSADSGSYREKSLLRQECPLDRMNLHQPRREETISDLSCTSLLSLSNLDQMTDDAVRFVFDQLCNDPNLDSICSTTTYHHHTERTEVDVIDSGVISNRTSASFSNSHVELVNSEPNIDVPTAAHEMASLAGGDLRSPSVQHGMDPATVPPASASAGFDMRPCYIKVLFPGPNGHPERIDIVEVIGSGVEIDGQSSPDGTMSVTDGSIPLVNNSQETAGENPVLMSSQGMSSYLHSSTTQVTSTLVEPSVSGWSVPDQTPCSNAFDNHAIPVGTVAYFGDYVAAADFPEDVSETEAAVQSLVSPSTDPSLQKPTIAESDLGGLRTLVAPSPCEDTHLLIDLSALKPSPAKVVSHSPAMKSGAMLTGPGFPDPGLWHKREKSAADYSPCKVAELGRTQDDSKKRKKHHPGNAIKMPEVEPKLDETTGGYRLTCDRMEKRRWLGFGVPGKIPESKSPESIAAVQTNPMLTGDIVQFQQPASSAARGCGSGSIPVFKTPDSNTDCMTVSDIPSLLHSQEEAVDFSRKDARGSKEQSGVLGRFRGSSTLSSVSTGSFTAGGISGPSTMSGGVVDASSSPVGSVHGVVNPLGRVVEYPSHGVAGPPTVCRSVVDSAGLPGDPVSPNVIASSPASSGSAESLSASIGSAGPCDPTESSGPCGPTESSGPCGPTESAGPCGPTESAKAPLTSASAATNFTRSVIAPSGATGDTPPRHPHNVTDERSGLNKRSVSKHKSKSARQAKSAVVYLEHVELSLCKEKLEGCDPSFLSAAFPPIHRTPSVSSDHALPSETPHKTTPRPKKKSKRTSDSGKNKSGHSNKKGKAHSSHNSMGKQAGEYGKAEKSRGASDATKAIQRDRKERETKRIEAMSNAVQYNIVSSDDDDLPIAYLIKSGAYRDLSSKYTKQDAGPATDKQSPHSTPLETLSNKESLEKDKRSGSSAKASGDKSSTQNSCKGLGEKVKTTREEQSKTTREESGKTTREERSKTAREEQSRTARIEQSKTTREEQSKFTRKEQSKTTRKEQSKPAKEEPWRITREEQSKPTKEEPGKTTRKEQSKPTKEEPWRITREEQSKPTRKEQLSDFSAITISDDSSLSDYSLQPNAPYAVSQTAQTSDERDGRCDKNTEPQLVVDVPGHFKIPKLRHSLPGRTSTWNTDHRYPSYRKSMDEVLSERWTSTASEEIPGIVPGKSHVTPLPSTPNPRNTSLPLSSKSVEHIHSDLRTSKTVVRTPSVDPSKSQTTSDTHASKPKPRPMVPSESFKPRVHIASNLVTLKPMVEIQGISRPKSQINSSKTTLVASAPDLQTASTPDSRTASAPDPRTASAPDPRTASAPVPRAAYMPDPRTTYTPDRGTTSAPDPRTASTPDPWTASSLTVSSIPPSKNCKSIARNAKSPKKSDCDKTQKRSSSGRSILLSPEESLNAHKRSKTKPSSKTKKTDQTIVSKQPVPSLLSRARKVREVSTCSEGLSYKTLLLMPSSLENLRQSLNEGEKETAPCDDDPIQIDSETERLETNTFVESGDGDDDVVIASALLSLSNSIPGNSGFTNIRQNGKSTETASSCFEDAGQSNRNSSDAGFEICRDPFPRYKMSCYNGESGLTNSDPEILYEKDTPSSSQAEITCSYDSGCVDLTTATRDFDLDGCSMKDLRTSSFSSPSIGLVVNIDEGSARTPSSPSTSTSACPSVPESHVDEYPGSWPSEEISKTSGKRRRSPSVDSDQKTRKLRKKLKGLDITAFLKQLHQPKNSN